MSRFVNLVDLFQHLSKNTWERIGDGYELSISQSEETLTDNNLLEIKRSGLKNIHIVKFNKPKEALYGIDWEWWIGSQRNGWIKFAVQAKKIYVPSKSYNTLDHKVKGRLQLDILDEYARKSQAVPLYCFYNYLLDTEPILKPFWRDCTDLFTPTEFGCTVTPSSIVRQALIVKQKKFEFIHQQRQTIPLYCLGNLGCIFKFRNNFDNFMIHGNLPSHIKYSLQTDVPLREIEHEFPKMHFEIRNDSDDELPKRRNNVNNGEFSKVSVMPKRILVINFGENDYYD
ncbi:MAG TPA: hypothetical protein PK299_12535 [Anaerolineales bacterium]|nr:hypothetical protein [Anaerolineales bacterium]